MTTFAGPPLKAKTVHRASKIDPNGNVSALCYRNPHAIDLAKATWTLLDSAVTCSKCKAHSAAEQPTEGTANPKVGDEFGCLAHSVKNCKDCA